MNKLDKKSVLGKNRADASADIELINEYSVKELKPEDVYCFSMILCDNETDRDMERFSDSALEELAGLFKGKTGVSDHRWSADRQIARLYRTETETTDKTTSYGAPYKVLRGDAYILNTEANKPFIEAVDGGIVKEISVGCAMNKCSCSICGAPLRLDLDAWSYRCENDHAKGENYGGKLCVGVLEEPSDAYEFSFVAVPSQRGAGVTKSKNLIKEAFETLQNEDIRGFSNEIIALSKKFKASLAELEEQNLRSKILRENKKFLNNKGEKQDDLI